MSFTDQKPRVVTDSDIHASWGGYKNGERFRCFICGHKFKVGDIWRWVHAPPLMNFFVCESCDCDNIVEVWKERHNELETKYWWLIQDYHKACNEYS